MEETKQTNDPQEHRMQNDLIMLGDDLKKYQREKMELEKELRTLKLQSERIKTDFTEKDNRMKKVDLEITKLTAEIRSMKKKVQGFQ